MSMCILKSSLFHKRLDFIGILWKHYDLQFVDIALSEIIQGFLLDHPESCIRVPDIKQSDAPVQLSTFKANCDSEVRQDIVWCKYAKNFSILILVPV